MTAPSDAHQPPPAETQRRRFIVGMPRAATTWMCKCLNGSPDLAAFGETLFWGRHYVPTRDDGTYGPAQIDAILARMRDGRCVKDMAGEGPGCLRTLTPDGFGPMLEEAWAPLRAGATPGELFEEMLRAVASVEDARFAIEKTPHHLNWIDRILAALPSACFLVMLREPYGFMLSYKHQGDRTPGQRQQRFRRRYHPAACALVWRTSMRAALRAAEQHPEQVLLVRQERIRTEGSVVLDEVQRFLGVEPQDLTSRVPPDNTSFPEGPRPELAAEDVFWMNLVAGRAVRDSGYERWTAPFRPLRIGWSIVRFPVWAVWNFFSLRRQTEGSFLGYLWRWVRPAG